MSYLSKQRKLLVAWHEEKSRGADRQRDFEQREVSRRNALAAARSVFQARGDRFVADGRH
jgi:hypothetical protein